MPSSLRQPAASSMTQLTMIERYLDLILSASAEGQACGADRMIFAPNDTDFHMFLFDNREV
jgi:hypothetical protein